MADRRYKHGIFQGNPKPRSPLDSPLYHGWHRAGTSPVTGAQLFKLGAATMRRVVPQDRQPDGWLVVLNEQIYHYTGSLAEITLSVRDMLPPIEREHAQHAMIPGHVIPLSAWQQEK